MPIAPENKTRYPKDWKTVVVPRIRARSGNRCECTGECGIRHSIQPHGENTMRCLAVNGEPNPITGSKVVLTVMHLNHTPEDCRDENLLHGCQGCHLRYDRAEHLRSSRHRASIKAGQEWLI